ncbi:hypothetical protein Taro_022835 [Colocasia esculenta]|uniref:DUF7054 domain-containing protein n=1 Tax=Colocasia esculenta TaxID=4460 RepID=A0A843VFL9_COLES|nr:hypothetical protein [Colocasia esculenta]
MLTQRPNARPERLRRLGGVPKDGAGAGRRLTRLLINVTVQRSLGPVQVVVPPESMVAELIKAAVEAYAKEGRRPLLPDTDPGAFELHYSQFSLESLSREEKLMNLGSRNFFLCHKPRPAPAGGDCRADEARKASSVLLLLPLSRLINISLRP